MRFDLFGIVFMAIAIFAGNFVGAFVSGFIGLTGGLIGALLIGLCVYAVYCLLTGQKMTILAGAIFALCVYGSGIVTAWISSATGFGGGIIGLLLNAVVLATIWGYFGKGKSPISTKSGCKGRRKSRR